MCRRLQTGKAPTPINGIIKRTLRDAARTGQRPYNFFQRLKRVALRFCGRPLRHIVEPPGYIKSRAGIQFFGLLSIIGDGRAIDYLRQIFGKGEYRRCSPTCCQSANFVGVLADRAIAFLGEVKRVFVT